MADKQANPAGRPENIEELRYYMSDFLAIIATHFKTLGMPTEDVIGTTAELGGGLKFMIGEYHRLVSEGKIAEKDQYKFDPVGAAADIEKAKGEIKITEGD